MWFARKLQKLLIYYGFGFCFFKATMAWKKQYGYYIESFGDLHCWYFLTSMMTFSLVIPHFSLAHVSGVCGMSSRSVIEMMNERRCHYYVFGSLLQSYHGLEAIWLLHCWCFLKGTMILSLVISHYSFANVLGCFSQFAR